MNVTQDNMVIEHNNVIFTEQCIIIPHKYSNFEKILSFWNTNMEKLVNKKCAKKYSPN